MNEHMHFHVCVVDGVIEKVELFHWTTLEQPLVADRFQPSAARQNSLKRALKTVCRVWSGT